MPVSLRVGATFGMKESSLIREMDLGFSTNTLIVEDHVVAKGGTIMQRREVVFTDCIYLARAALLQTFVVSYIDTD